MDVMRSRPARGGWKRYLTIGAIALVAVVLIFSATRMSPEGPGVKRNALWVETVQRGEMVREVKGNGVLAPNQVRVVTARTAGVVEEILQRPGMDVTADTVLMQLTNPALSLELSDAEADLRAAESQYSLREVQLTNDALAQESKLVSVTAAHKQADLQAAADKELAKEGLISDLLFRKSLVTAEELADQVALEQKRLQAIQTGKNTELTAQQNRVEKLRARFVLTRERIESLTVRAGLDGRLQQLPLEPGQRVEAGAVLAKVARPGDLMAVLKIPQNQTRELALEQPAEIDTRNGVVRGVIKRIDPAVVKGTVDVEVALHGDLPAGARPDLQVDGVIILERLENVWHVARPVFGEPGSQSSVFRLSENGKTASRTPVIFGRGSVNTIEIVEGLQPGDRIILSDTSAWNQHQIIRLIN